MRIDPRSEKLNPTLQSCRIARGPGKGYALYRIPGTAFEMPGMYTHRKTAQKLRYPRFGAFEVHVRTSRPTAQSDFVVHSMRFPFLLCFSLHRGKFFHRIYSVRMILHFTVAFTKAREA